MSSKQVVVCDGCGATLEGRYLGVSVLQKQAGDPYLYSAEGSTIADCCAACFPQVMQRAFDVAVGALEKGEVSDAG